MEAYQELSMKLRQWKDPRGLATRAGPDRASLARAIEVALCERDMTWRSSDIGWPRDSEELVKSSHEVLGPASNRSALDSLMIHEAFPTEVALASTVPEFLVDGKESRSHGSDKLDAHGCLVEGRIPKTEQDTAVSNDRTSESDVDHDVLEDARRFLRTLAVWTFADDSEAPSCRTLKFRRPNGYRQRRKVQNYIAILKAAAAGLACPSILMLAAFSNSNPNAHLQTRTFDYSSGTVSARFALKRDRNTRCVRTCLFFFFLRVCKLITDSVLQFSFPEMLLMPSVPEFLLACSVYSTVSVLAYRLNRRDQHQGHFLMTGVLFGVLLGVLMGWDVNEIVLGLLPSMASLSLWSSQIFHQCVAREGAVCED